MGRAAKLKAARKEMRQTSEYKDLLRTETRRLVERGFSGYQREFVCRNIYAILAVLVVDFGFGAKRLERFVQQYEKTINGLIDRYEYNIDDIMPECEKIVRATGFNLDSGFWDYK